MAKKKNKKNKEPLTLAQVYARLRETFHKDTYVKGADNPRKEVSKKKCRGKVKLTDG